MSARHCQPLHCFNPCFLCQTASYDVGGNTFLASFAGVTSGPAAPASRLDAIVMGKKPGGYAGALLLGQAPSSLLASLAPSTSTAPSSLLIALGRTTLTLPAVPRRPKVGLTVQCIVYRCSLRHPRHPPSCEPSVLEFNAVAGGGTLCGV
jgi:hypothetical protein